LDSPNNADWAVNALAPASSDSTNNALVVRRFDDTAEEGVGFMLNIPTGRTNIVFGFKSRAESAPASAHNVLPRVYVREIPDNGAIESWSGGYNLNTLSMPTNVNFQYDSQSVAFTSLDITGGRLAQFEVTRYHTGVTPDLTGDWDLLELNVSFT
jgi:hypothetical protein